ncbi:hypothetical protein RUM43_004817 [Polyplax serrata]|uniref:Uncharacterized protein n=1 Tax=Polyplax serrata TaxID=468196 RepID=A0AAN8SDE0_POLSC
MGFVDFRNYSASFLGPLQGTQKEKLWAVGDTEEFVSAQQQMGTERSCRQERMGTLQTREKRRNEKLKLYQSSTGASCFSSAENILVDRGKMRNFKCCECFA